MMQLIINYQGLVFLILGLFTRYQIGRRRFNRRSIAGVQIYSSYLKGMITTIIETIFNLVGAALILAGLISLILHL